MFRRLKRIANARIKEEKIAKAESDARK